MNILIYLAHPAQFLFYKNAISELKIKGHNISILIKTKDILSDLLDEAGLKYTNILPKSRGRSKLSILHSLMRRDYKVIRFARNRDIQMMLGSDASVAHAGRILRIPSITVLEDDYEVIKSLAILTFPFTTTILAPEVCRVGKWEKKKISYHGFMKLAYLHPKRFIPDKDKLLNNLSSPYYLIRLSNLSAHHDFGIKGISDELLDRIIRQLEKKGEVYISSEKQLNNGFKKYQLKIPFSNIHHYLYFADMLISDSQSMSVEAAILGTPNIRISGFAGKISVLEELEHKFQLTFGFNPNQEDAIVSKIAELLSHDKLNQQFQALRQKMLSEKIDVTAFLVWFIENYPESFNIMKANPDYQYNFK